PAAEMPAASSSEARSEVPPRPPIDPTLALARIAPFFAELELPPPTLAPPAGDAFEAQLEAALASGAAVFSFTVVVRPATAIAAIKARGMVLVGTATTVDEAIALERSGVDAIVAQGSEAGGHRGTFGGDFESGMVGTIALVPQVVDA